MDVQSIKDWFKNLPPQNIGLALLAILFIAFAGSKGLEIISNLTKDSSISNPISKESSSPASKTPDLEDINIIVQERESLKPIEGVEIEYIVEGPSVRKYTDRNGQRGISIPSTRAVEITLRKRGYKTAPDTINLQVDPKKTKIFYLDPEPSQARPNQSSMLVPSTPASNSSPSPKPTQKIFEENFEGDLVTMNKCDPKDSKFPQKGHTGQGLQVTNLNKTWGCRSFQLPGVFKGGKTYQASVWCKADIRAECMFFFGDDEKDYTEAYENKERVTLQGNGEWQKITTPLIKMSHDERMIVQVYSTVPGKSVIFDDILVEEVINQ